MKDKNLELIAKQYIKKNTKWGNKWRKDRAWFLKARNKVDMPIIMPEALLRIKLLRDGETYNFGIVSRKKVTAEFVNFMVDQLQAETSTWGDFKYHISGTGTDAESNANTQLQTAIGTAREVGTQTEGASAHIYKSVATIAYSGTHAVTEHALFNEAYADAQDNGILMDRSVFSAVNVVSGDSIEFTYQLTCTAEA